MRKITKVEDFVSELMSFRNITHMLHSQAEREGSYAKHMALNELYEALPDHIDEIVEFYQGYYGKIISEYTSGDIEIYDLEEALPVVLKYLQGIEQYRYVVFNKENSPLQNIIDELIATMVKAVYKLRFLK